MGCARAHWGHTQGEVDDLMTLISKGGYSSALSCIPSVEAPLADSHLGRPTALNVRLLTLIDYTPCLLEHPGKRLTSRDISLSTESYVDVAGRPHR